MSDNFVTIWLQQKLNELSAAVANRIVQKTGRALPCSVTAVNGSIVTVKFEVTGIWTLPPLKIPKAESQWCRTPTQVGDFGFTVAADSFLGAVSGQSPTPPDLSVDYGNLGTLVFVPIGSVNFSTTPDANKVWINGPNGVVISDNSQAITLVVDKASGTIQLAGAGTSSGNGIINETMLQNAINAAISTMVTWSHANFAAGTNSAPAPTNPTVTGSSKSFTT